MATNRLVCVAAFTAALTASIVPAHSKSLLVDISACTNDTVDFGQPVGTRKGNAGTDFASIEFILINFAKKPNFWRGIQGASLNIELAVPKASAVQLLINTGWGQNGIPNALVTIAGTGGVKKTFKLIGNKTIRDYNNFSFTNTIDGKNTQEWWTNNKHPTPNDLSHRYDAHVIDVSDLLGNETLTQISVKSPKDSATGFFEPFVFAVNVEYDGKPGPKPSCSAKS